MFNSFSRSVIGVLVFTISMYLGLYVYHHLPVMGYIFHPPSFFLVIGLVIGVTFLILEYRDYGRFFTFLFTYSISAEKNKSIEVESKFEEALNVCLKDGPIALAKYAGDNNFPSIWQVVAKKLEIKVPIADIRGILEHKVRSNVGKLDQDIVLQRQLSSLSPAMGLLGTVLGLIRLLADMKDISNLSGNMSLALMTTLYGIFIGNVVFIPFAVQVEKRKDILIKNHESIIYWLSALEEKKPSFYLKNKLREITS